MFAVRALREVTDSPETGPLTTGQLSYEASNDIAAAFGISTIALALRHFCLGLAAPICRK